jgi:hypothetical protein
MPRPVAIASSGLVAVATLGLLHAGAGPTDIEPGVLAPVCADRPPIVTFLDAVFAERSVGAGLGSDGQVHEIFATPGGATWTFVVTNAQGTSCGVAVGEGWERPADPSHDPVREGRL